MSEPKVLSQVVDETKALVRDLVAEVGELRKHPAIAGLPGPVFTGVDGANQRLQNHLTALDTTTVVETPDAAGAHSADDQAASATSTETTTATAPPATDPAKSPTKASSTNS